MQSVVNPFSMNNGIRIKVCGLTTLGDALFADQSGADFLGFIFYPPSPRGITLEQFRVIYPQLSAGKKVAVSVSPTMSELRAFAEAGADFFQVHFPADTPLATVQAWSQAVGPGRLWLAPKLPRDTDVAAAWLPLADSLLLDTFHADKFGGTGATGDWAKFARHQQAQPTKTWILSGGLNPDNIAGALSASGAKFVDVNSGVESAPGVKDQDKIKAFFGRIR
jgi:phosphoribosylanthranilate isomerase